jgi:cysteine desulfurase
MNRPIYLDRHATTPVDERVLAAMLPYFTERFGNATSTTHEYGWEVAAAVDRSRERIAAVIGAEPREIIFTSGATEANNLALKGVAEAYYGKGQHIITAATEHNAILDPCEYLAGLGFEITYLPVGSDGIIDVDLLKQSLRSDTILVSMMAANNEIGVLQPLTEIGRLCRQENILFHTDAAQAIGQIPIDVNSMHIDLLSITAHKIYGPKGIGALYVRSRNPRVKLSPQLHGGGHERGMRSGTLYSPQIVGMAEAIDIATSDRDAESSRLLELRQRLWVRLQELPEIYLNGHPDLRLPGNLNISIAGVDGNALLLGLRDTVALSSGAACSSAKIAPSHVLKAIGRNDRLAYAALRFGIGRSNTAAEIDRVAAAVISTVTSLRQSTLI